MNSEILIAFLPLLFPSPPFSLPPFFSPSIFSSFFFLSFFLPPFWLEMGYTTIAQTSLELIVFLPLAGTTHPAWKLHKCQGDF